MTTARQIAYVPKCTPPKGKPWFIVSLARDLKREARADFAKYCREDWKKLKKAGWRIVAVEVIG